MSPLGKRRHNELNAAPPPETPRRTGATGGGSDRDVVHSGKSFCIRGKNLFARRAARHDSAFAFPSRGRLTVGFCFGDRDFVTASPGVYAILCSCKERLCQESTLRGLRREVRFIMSPPGKRRHNELNAAPPPETPRGTGKPGETTDRENVHSGERFCIRGKSRLLSEPRGTIPPLPSPQGEGSLSDFV